MRDVNPETITCTLSWYKVLPPSGFNPIRAKQNLHMRRKNSVLKFLEPSQAPKVENTDNSMEFGTMCGFVMESQHFNTSSIRDEWHRWKSRPTSEGRYVSSIATVGLGWKVVVRFHGMLLLSAKCPKPLGRLEDTVWKTIWRIIQSANSTFCSNGWISSVFTESINLARKYCLTWIGNDGCIRCLHSKNQSKGSIDQPERWRIRFPIRRWNSRIVRKRVRIPSTPSETGTTCKEWRSQWRNFRRIGRVSTDRTHRWRWSPGRFWSIRGDFIYRHHTEPRVLLYVPKEETFFIPLNTLMLLGLLILVWVSCKKRRLTITGMLVRASFFFSDSWRGFTKFFDWKGTLQKDTCGQGGDWQRFKRLPD